VVSLGLAAAAGSAVETPCSFEVPAGDALRTLKEFAAQAGREIVFAPGGLDGVKTNAVSGDHTPREALGLMLAGTGLVAKVDPGTGAVAVRLDDRLRDTARGPAKVEVAQANPARETGVVRLPVVEVIGSRPSDRAVRPESEVEHSVVYAGGARLAVSRFHRLPELKGMTYILLPLQRAYLGTAQFQEYADLTAEELGARGMVRRAMEDAGKTDYLITLDYALGEPSLGVGETGGPGGGTHPIDDRYPHLVDLKIYNGRARENGEWVLRYEGRVNGMGYGKDLSLIVPRSLKVILTDLPDVATFPLGPRDQ
jgi:hypothetical protein